MRRFHAATLDDLPKRDGINDVIAIDGHARRHATAIRRVKQNPRGVKKMRGKVYARRKCAVD